MTPTPPKLIACVRPINWAIERLRRRRASRRGEGAGRSPLVLVQTTANRQVVVTMCHAARAQGVRAGLSLAQARALCPDLVYAEHDAGRDVKALEALGRWMTRFTPTVQVSEGGLFLDVTGTDRLFGSPQMLLGRVEEALGGLGIPARLAIAPTVGAAWALTFDAVAGMGRAPQAEPLKVVVTIGDLPAAISSLPPMALRLDDATLTGLHHLGLHTIGQLLAIPRDLIPARFGPTLLMRIDQALGRVAEPLVPLVYHPPVEAAVDFDGIVDSLEPLYLSFKDLIGRVAGQLVRRGLGARRMVVTFYRPYAAAIEKTIDLSGPSRNVNVLFNLIRCAMETIGDVRPARGKRPARIRVRGGVETAQASPARTLDETDFVPRGFTGLRLAVPIFERLSEEQILLLEQEEHRGRLELDRLVERLHIRLGREALVAVQPVESHVPEKAYRVGKEEKGSGVRGQGSAKKRKSTRGLWRSEESAVVCAENSRRPLHLLSSPVSVRVMVRPSHDRDGAPVSFTHEGDVHRIVHAVGPERIGGAWWVGHDKTRDYFDVEDESGRRWWLFRVLQTSKWYLHGRFE